MTREVTASIVDLPDMKSLLSIVLPVYNEQESLGELHRKIVRVMTKQAHNYELIFVDDGSTDGSLDVLRALQQQDTKVRIIQFRRNFGKAAAYSAGFHNARGDVILTLDTDLQDDPDEIPRFLAKLAEDYDMVVGWKYEGKGTFVRSLASKVFNTVVSFATGVRLHDFNCPLKMYRKQVLQEIEIYGELHRFIPVLAHAKGFSLAEIRVKNLPRLHGKSKYGVQRYIRGMFDLLTVILVTRFSKRPLHLLGLGGLIACTLGLSVLSFLIMAHILYRLGLLADTSWNIHDRPALSLGILLIITGAQFFSIGLLGELLTAQSHSRTQNVEYSVKQIFEDES